MRRKEILSLGEDFHWAAQEIIPENFLDDENGGHWFIPYVVNLAFACELYLKVLLFDDGSVIWGHNLSELHHKLDSRYREEIENSSYFRGDERFMQKLDDNSSVFEKWRYYFEDNMDCKVDVIFLENYASSLYEIATSCMSEESGKVNK